MDQETQKNTQDKNAKLEEIGASIVSAAEKTDSASSSAPGVESVRETSKPPKHHLADSVERIDKPLAECYPKVADDENEKLIADVRKHWIGRFFIIFTGAFLSLFLLLFAVLLPTLTKSASITLNSQTKGFLVLVFLLVDVFVLIGTFITLWVYNQSHMLITDQNVIELKQMSLFSRKVSHLNMINVEDVSVVKRGILQTFFNYGTMTIETAGEEENFAFPNTPKPDDYRRIVINAHEEAIERVGHMGPVQRVAIADSQL
jgi:hypothetical protein